MGAVHKIKVKLKKRIHDFIWKMADLPDLEDQVRSTSYFVRKSIDPKQIPAADGPMRDLQLCDVQLLRIFHEICKKQGWTYWLDYGTLLGSVRHGGFIPWDDDMDVSVPRDVFDDMAEKLPGLMEKYGIDVEDRPGFPMSRLGFSYKHQDTGVWLDIFPVDYRNCTKSVYEGREDFLTEMKSYRDFYYANRNKLSNDELSKARERLIPDQEGGKHRIVFCSLEFNDGNCLYEYEQIFPLRDVTFENYTFCGPGKTEEFLTLAYDAHYMSLPARGVESHSGAKGPLATWAAKSGTNMQEVYKELKAIADELAEENK